MIRRFATCVSVIIHDKIAPWSQEVHTEKLGGFTE